ncbi:MAG: N-formylglutamate amidohydrolase [Devosiaceae bacterium]|nr:N-formylglutamate amidohydrolase [Devosiaceae bacterium]
MNNSLHMQIPTATSPDNFTPELLGSGETSCSTINKGGAGPVVLVCEHASPYIPKYFNGLGLADEIKSSHIAWDPGAFDLAKCLSSKFDAPLVHSNISRLVYDCNRGAGEASAMTARSEIFDVPGNVEISSSEAHARIEQIYNPFSITLDKVIEEKKSLIATPLLVTIHSFTPVYFGQKRDVEIGILHSSDSRLANEMLALAPMFGNIKIERNQPYGPEDGVAHTLEEHGIKNNLPNVMIEVRNDLLADSEGAKRICEVLFKLISLSQPKLVNSANGEQ